MRKQVLRGTALCGALFLATIAWAESRPRIHVDFLQPVNVGTETLPAGHYTFQQIRSRTNAPIFRVRRADGTNMGFTAIGATVRAPATASSNYQSVTKDTDIVLDKSHGKYYLDKIWIAGRGHGWAFNIPT